jgi:hypothetical protein
MTIRKKLTYLIGIFIGVPTEQHSKIKDIAAKLSDGEYEFVHLHRMGAFHFVPFNQCWAVSKYKCNSISLDALHGKNIRTCERQRHVARVLSARVTVERHKA